MVYIFVYLLPRLLAFLVFLAFALSCLVSLSSWAAFFSAQFGRVISLFFRDPSFFSSDSFFVILFICAATLIVLLLISWGGTVDYDSAFALYLVFVFTVAFENYLNLEFGRILW